MIERTRRSPDGAVIEKDLLPDHEVPDDLAGLAHVLDLDHVTLHRRDGAAVEYRRVDAGAELELTADELLREHGIRTGDEGPSPADRIGTAVSLLGEVRRLLYGARDGEPVPALDDAVGEARPKLTRLWIELVNLENFLTPSAPDEEAVDA